MYERLTINGDRTTVLREDIPRATLSLMDDTCQRG